MTSETAARVGPTIERRVGDLGTAPDGAAAAPGRTSGAVVGLLLVLAAPLAAALVHLAASGAGTFAAWVVLVVGLVAWSPVSRRWSRLRRLGPVVAVLYLGVGAVFLLG